jgi:hypothetical protein
MAPAAVYLYTYNPTILLLVLFSWLRQPKKLAAQEYKGEIIRRRISQADYLEVLRKAMLWICLLNVRRLGCQFTFTKMSALDLDSSA